MARNPSSARAPPPSAKRLVAKNSALAVDDLRGAGGLRDWVSWSWSHESGGPRSLGVFQFALTLTAMLPVLLRPPEPPRTRGGPPSGGRSAVGVTRAR